MRVLVGEGMYSRTMGSGKEGVGVAYTEYMVGHIHGEGKVKSKCAKPGENNTMAHTHTGGGKGEGTQGTNNSRGWGHKHSLLSGHMLIHMGIQRGGGVVGEGTCVQHRHVNGKGTITIAYTHMGCTGKHTEDNTAREVRARRRRTRVYCMWQQGAV